MTPETIVGAAVVALIAFAVVIGVLIVRRTVDVRPSPTVVVLRYLSAISSGDAATANALFDPAAIERDAFPTATDRIGFMTDAALGLASELISDVMIGRVTRAPGSNSAVVYYSFTIAGERFTDRTIILKWDGTDWRITHGVWALLQIRPVFTGESTQEPNLSLRLGDAAPQRPDLAFDGSFLVYPGVYPLHLESVGWVVEPGGSVPTQVAVAGARATVVRPRFIPQS